MNILYFMGMTSIKYGALERNIVALAKKLDTSDRLMLVYHSPVRSNAYLEDLRKCNVDTTYIPSTTYVDAIRNFKQIVRLLSSFRPDIVHFHFGNSYLILLPLCRLMGIKKTYLTVHSCITRGNHDVATRNELGAKTKLLHWDGHVFNLFRTIFFVSQYTLHQFEAIWGQRKNTFQIYLGITPPDKSYLKQSKKTQNPKRITCIAFASPIKGVDTLVEALHILRQSRNDFVFTLIGFDDESPFSRDIRQKLDSYNIQYEWAGITDNTTPYLMKTDIYCQPSRTEALCLAAAETSLYGIPVVASATGGLPEIVHDGDNGRLCPPEDTRAFADAIGNILDHPEQLPMQYDTRQLFDMNKSTDTILASYRQPS